MSKIPNRINCKTVSWNNRKVRWINMLSFILNILSYQLYKLIAVAQRNEELWSRLTSPPHRTAANDPWDTKWLTTKASKIMETKSIKKWVCHSTTHALHFHVVKKSKLNLSDSQTLKTKTPSSLDWVQVQTIWRRHAQYQYNLHLYLARTISLFLELR